MTDTIADIQLHVDLDAIQLEWNMPVQNRHYLWAGKELVVRLFCPLGMKLGDLSTTKSFAIFESSETDTHVGQVTAGVGIISAASGVNKSHEISRPIVLNYGLVHENRDDAPHYRFSIDMTKINPPISDGYEQFAFTWKITNIQSATREIEMRAEFGHVSQGLFEREYAAQRNILLPPDEQDTLQQSLNRVLMAIQQRLNATMYGLDSIFLALELDEKSGVVAQSQLFRPYAVDINPPTTAKPLANVDEAFEKYSRRLLLLGNAGAGKSTTLLVFTKKLIEERLRNPSAKIPVYAPMTNWRGEIPIRDWIVQESQLPAVVQQEIDRGRVIFLLDGLDEIPTGNPQDRALPNKADDLQVKFLEKFREELFANDVVITCRDHVYRDLQSRSHTGIYLEGAVVIQPLNNDQIRSYLLKQRDLWDVVQKDSRLLDLVRTPLLLRIFAVAFRGISDQARELALVQDGDGALRDEIFKVYVRQRCVHEAQKQPARFSTQDKIVEWVQKIYDVLGKVAAEGQYHRKKHIEELLGNEAEDFIEQMCNLHILMRTPSEDVEFIHLFLEYHFAWKPLLVDLKNQHPHWSTVRRLGEIRDRRAVQPLIQSLKHSFGFTSRDIARSLGEIGDSEAVSALIGLLSHRDQDTRKEAIRALGLIGDSRSIVPLIEMLNENNSITRYPSDIQRLACLALEQIGDAAVSPLCNSLSDERIYVRTEAARTLAFIKDERATMALIDALSRSEARAEIPYPNFVMGYVDATNTLLRVESKPARLIHTDKDISMYVFALSAIGKAAIEPLIHLYENTKAEMKAAAMWALAPIQDSRLLDFYLDALDSDQAKVRVYAVYGLAKNCGLDTDKDGYLMPRAAKNGYPMLRLMNLVNERPISQNLFNCSLWALGVIGQPFSVDAVIHYLSYFTDEHGRSKFHAIGGLGLSGDKRATSALIPFLKDSDHYVRVCTAEALGRLKDEDAVDPLLSALNDEEQDVRRHVIEALGKIGDKRAAKPLVAQFADNVHSVSEALLQLGEQSILPVLAAVAEKHERQDIRKSASDLICRMKLHSS